MQQSFASDKLFEKIPANPEEQVEHSTILKPTNELKIQQSHPIPQHKKLSNHEFSQNNLNANSSASLTEQSKSGFSIHSYRFNQSYYTRQQLIEQQNFCIVTDADCIYAGGMKNGLKHGLGVLITKNTVFQGQFSLNHKNGKGYIQYPNKSRYFGDFSNDKPHGHGMLQYGSEYYIGDFENGMMHGDGLWKNEKGQKYVGKWKTNKAHGYGMYVTENSHYQGEFNTFQKHGYGHQTFNNGDVYKGNYRHGKPNGYGHYIWQNRASYKGNFINGLRDGEGQWVNEIGDQYQGFFKNDKKNGKGTYKWANSNLYVGEFQDDMRHGTGDMVWNDGSTYQGEWTRGLPNGKGLYQAKGQKPKYGIFQDNVLIQELKSYSVPKQMNSQDSRGRNYSSAIQKSKLYLNIIPEYPKKRNIPESRSFNRKAISQNKTARSTMGSFRVTSTNNSLSWRNR